MGRLLAAAGLAAVLPVGEGRFVTNDGGGEAESSFRTRVSPMIRR
jgi:hypothetical protein